MQTLHIQDSTIYIGESYLNLNTYLPNGQVVMITDENVYRYYSSFIDNYKHIIIPAGETSKTWQGVESIVTQLLELNADRHTFLVGMGGGVVTDVTGFVASIFMRGISFCFIATSLLAQVDASLGGKNGINFAAYKNMLGTFNAPEFVICDAASLKTLPKREVRSGFGEILKHALIKDVCLLNFLENNVAKLLALEEDTIANVVWQAIRIKAAVVSEDWREEGERKKLNFGHTLAHAIENNSDLTHGEAVAVGMLWATKRSVGKNYLSRENISRITKLLQSYELPISHEIKTDSLIAFIQKDKKKKGDAIDFVFLKELGEAIIIREPITELIEALHNIEL